ncbi:Serine/threonine protein kinase [hydrothermal vent metagenome]|uniref:Serine/threonine protein kinase n=1 Tax=hydrothermal vent metagenome TaxID=652676 RepID=A0A3B0YPL8_9ZZZZ
MRKKLDSLKPGTCLDGYKLEKPLGGGGFSVVYLARNLRDNKRVVIKEYIPNRLACRANNGNVQARDESTEALFVRGRKLFFQEASALATLKHPNIVDVFSFFQANGTVYMVMKYEPGENLQHYLQSRRGKGLSERFLRTVFPPLLDGLELIHNNDLLHLDIKPGNIHICHGGRPLLLDFGAVHGHSRSPHEQPGKVISTGFSPNEQYENQGSVGPWTDLYALGATMRACIEGHAPMDAKRRRERDALKPAQFAWRGRYEDNLLRAIDWAMEVDPERRPQSVSAFRAALTADTRPEPKPIRSAINWLTNTLLGRSSS